MSEKKPILLVRIMPPKGVLLGSEDFERIQKAFSEANLPYKTLILSADLEIMTLESLKEFAIMFSRRVAELESKPLEA